MKNKAFLLVCVIVIILAGNLLAQDIYRLDEIKPVLSTANQKQLEKAEKYLNTANEQMKQASDLESTGKNKTKAVNKKLSASKDYGNAHKIIYDVYLENVQKLTKGSDNSGTVTKNTEKAAKSFKEAKKKRESSLRNTVPDQAYKLSVEAENLEKSAITTLTESYFLLTGYSKPDNQDKNVNQGGIVIQDKGNANKAPVKSNSKVPEDQGLNETNKNQPQNVNNRSNQDEKINTNVNQATKNTEFVEHDKNGVYFKIQIAASKSPLTVEQLNAIYKTNEMYNVDKDGEWYKYYISNKFLTYEEATEYKSKLNIKGIFLVAFKDGKKISIEEALKKDNIKTDQQQNKTIAPVNNNQIQENKTLYRLQIGISTKPMSAAEISQFKNGGKPVITFDHGGWFSYNIGDFNSEQEAINFKKTKGLTDAEVVKFVNGVLAE